MSIRKMVLGAALVSCSVLSGAGQGSAPLILDMVHHNPGEAPYESKYNDPAVIKEMGYNGKVYFLFESPMLAINWESVDADILPVGSEDRKWVDAKAAQIREMHAESKANGIAIFAQSDLMLFPKRLIAKYGIEETFGDPQHPETIRFLRAQINEMFDQFPDLEGLVVRIGETYLHDAPFHEGSILDKSNAERTIIPLMSILREEICEKRDKMLIFRTWRAFDENLDTYMAVSDAIEPHEKLIISVKHCEGDFHRANPFSKVIGQGRHRQIIEVQCAREYEGKGAYPNYVLNGVIDGFEEHRRMPEGQINSIREFVETKPELYAGIWTWTRGGGWGGPYIKDEMWCDLNAWVSAQWALDPSQSEEYVFNRYAVERLGLKESEVSKFRRLCLLSADAVVRGRNTTFGDMNPWWTRDQGINWPKANEDADKQLRSLKQKDEAIEIWEEIVELAKTIQWPNEDVREHAIGSCYYGLRLFEIYRCLVYMSDAEAKQDTEGVKQWITAYDQAWERYEALPEKYSSLATLYTQEYRRHIAHPAQVTVERLREQCGK